MEFMLHYRGPLTAKPRPVDKHAIRKHFHQQLAQLWNQLPLSDFRRLLQPFSNPKAAAQAAAPGPIVPPGDPEKYELCILRTLAGFNFAPLVCTRIHLVAAIDVLLLRPEAPGAIITTGGDIDNRLKTLLDALRMPSNAAELPKDAKPSDGEDPFFCLLEDDHLVTSVSVRTDRLLEPTAADSEVITVIRVTTTQLRMLRGTAGLA